VPLPVPPCGEGLEPAPGALVAFNVMASRWAKLYRGTPAEIAVENAIAELGVPYRNQFPLYMYGSRFFLDFLLPTLGVVIEIDDPSHRQTDKMLADAERTGEIESKFGWRVLRTTNEKALSDPRGAIQDLLSEAGITPLDIENARRRPLAECMPQPGKCPAPVRRAAKSAARRRRRAA
jgi:very-short-patch-repair endonuclease